MRVLVTGGAGYIGSVLSKILVEKGHDVSCLDRFFFGKEDIENVSDKINLIKDDIRWFNSDILKGVDAVLDLASLSNDPSGELDPQKTLEINYKGRVRVATLSKKYKVGKYVLASTCSVYGFQEGTLNEDSKLNPLTTYAKANMMAEKEVLPLTDTSNAFISVLESNPKLVNGQIFNVGNNEQNLQIFDLAKMVAESINLPFNFEWYGSPDMSSYKVSFDKIKEQT